MGVQVKAAGLLGSYFRTTMSSCNITLPSRLTNARTLITIFSTWSNAATLIARLQCEHARRVALADFYDVPVPIANLSKVIILGSHKLCHARLPSATLDELRSLRSALALTAPVGFQFYRL